MLRIGSAIFSFDILEKKFKCDLSQCFGNCCRYGDSGAPLSEAEAEILEKIWPELIFYVRPEGTNVIEREGTSTTDFENELVTPLINNAECAYTILRDNIFMCAIEKAWSEGKVTFRKPLSCHLFPVRIKNFSDFKAVNYQELFLCSSARECGNSENIYVYEYLKTPLIRALGEEIYNDLCKAAEELRKNPVH